jgi:tetratricopeptide (TPR) repeat protein
MTHRTHRQTMPVICLIVVAVVSTVTAQDSQLGKVDFPTSGSEKAQAHFLRGLAALHSFWYQEALEAFRESTRIEPDFMMGYWGEAMAHNHSLWSEQDTAAARDVIKKLADTPKLTARERAYLQAVKALYGEGDKRARDAAYSAAMEKLYRDYAGDLDAAAFYSLSLLSLVRSEERSYRLQARAGAIALDVFEKNPNHPGAAHYIIHAFDDPDHAILALPAARRYAGIAPAAHHARHMPSHIFLQLGMWPEAAASNESAWEASESWMKRKNLSPGVRDYHSLHWLLYVYLQQGRYSRAEELLALMKKTMSETSYDNKLRPGYYQNNYASMAAAFIVETERWNLTSTHFPATSQAEQVAAVSPASQAHGSHGAGPPVSSPVASTVRTSDRGQRLSKFIRGLATALGDSAMAGKTGTTAGGTEPSTIGEFEIAAVTASAKGDHQTAAVLMKRAIKLEEEMGPPSGPPDLIKPSHELFGELLLRAGKHDEAREQFKVSLSRQPNRARSLLGAARAAAKAGDQGAAVTSYKQLLEQWQQADEGLPELSEARDYLKKVKL